MKYSESYQKSKFAGSAAFYIIIACCLLAIGGASWFAVSSISRRDEENKNSETESISSVPDISSDISSIFTPSETSSSTDVNESVTDEPYESTEPSSEEETASTPEAPVFTMPVQGEILKAYSDKELQYSATYGDMRVHTGIDIACANGTAVSACGAGTVISVEESATLGNIVTIDHGNEITAKYASIKDVKLKAGDKVAAGDIIGSVTTIPSECADQSHLHLEVLKNGHTASPLEILGLE